MLMKMTLFASLLLLAPLQEETDSAVEEMKKDAAKIEAPAETDTPQQDVKPAEKDAAEKDAVEKDVAENETTKDGSPKNDAAPQQAANQGPALKLISIEQNIIRLTNVERTKRGLPALKIDPYLMTSARQHGAWMARHRNMVHTKRPVAENIAMGQHNSQAAVRAWMNSSGHRANILNRGYKRIGAAAYRTQSGTIYWCQQFRR